MNPTSSQSYADLSDDSYADRKTGIRDPGKDKEYVVAGGTKYQVLEHVSNRSTGYQGTIYQRTDNGEIVVAHRGTEFAKWGPDKGEFTRDVLGADGGMLLAKVNLQAEDAKELTRHAIDYAKEYAARPGHHYAPPTVTGHSLGGTLAQITSHYFGLKGESFNAYGARSLDPTMGEGHGWMVNHVAAGDPISAASPQFGDTIVYSKREEIASLDYLRADPSVQGSVATGAMRVGDSHRLYNFLSNKDGEPHLSMLSDPQARQLAADNAGLISLYRSNIGAAREGIALGTSTAVHGPLGAAAGYARETLHARHPVAPGEGWAQEQAAASQRKAAAGALAAFEQHHHRPSLAEQRGEALDAGNWRTPLKAPSGLTRPEDQQLHCQLLAGVSRLGLPAAGNDSSTDGPGQRLAADLLRQCKQDGLTQADHVVRGQGEPPRVFAVQGNPADPAHLRAHVGLEAAVKTPAAESFAKVEQLNHHHDQQAAAARLTPPPAQPESQGPVHAR